jgi:UDP-N-acetylmuramate--alanine ligase
MFRGKVQRIHFIGIGGSGMSGIAEVLLTMGYAVSGSDAKESATTAALRALGGTVHIGHDPGHVRGVDVVVRSTAIRADNPEVRAAEAAKIPVIPRAEMLGELMRMKYGLAVAGTHGKTTTTSMLARCMAEAGFDPTIVIGGKLDAIGSSARLGAGEFMVAEADESDGSFLLLDPTVAIITNIDPEHLDHWGSTEALLKGFTDFANKVPFYGFAVLCLDHPNVQRILPRVRRRVVTYGQNPQAEVRAENIVQEGMRTRFTVLWRDEPKGEVVIGMPGLHNVANALAAIAVGLELGVPFERLEAGLRGFTGVDRRFSVRARISLDAARPPVHLIDDYAHHPAEIVATLSAAQQVWPRERRVAVFQPHRFTRVRDLLEDFARAFNHATEVLVTPIYKAGETPIPDIDHHRMASLISDFGHRHVGAVDSLDELVERLAPTLGPGDVVITLGAGDVNRALSEIAERLRARG